MEMTYFLEGTKEKVEIKFEMAEHNELERFKVNKKYNYVRRVLNIFPHAFVNQASYLSTS
jgi:hypothetical protein